MGLKKITCPRCGSGAVHYTVAGVGECSDRACWLSKGIPIHDWRCLRFAPSPEPLNIMPIKLDFCEVDAVDYKPWMDGGNYIPEEITPDRIREAMSDIIQGEYKNALKRLEALV